jgi:hypothetical protein
MTYGGDAPREEVAVQLGRYVRSGVAHPLRDEATDDVTPEPVGAVVGEADAVRTGEADDRAPAAVPVELRDEPAR